MKMVAVDSDDLWFAYNLIAPGDSVMAVTVRYATPNSNSVLSFIADLILISIFCKCNRKVLREAAHGGRDAERVKLKLEIKVEEVISHFINNLISILFYSDLFYLSLSLSLSLSFTGCGL